MLFYCMVVMIMIIILLLLLYFTLGFNCTCIPKLCGGFFLLLLLLLILFLFISGIGRVTVIVRTAEGRRNEIIPMMKTLPLIWGSRTTQ